MLLEYGCLVWHSGLTATQSHSLDRAQKVALATIVVCWKSSHTLYLEQLGLERLAPRRTKLCKRFAHLIATNSRNTNMFAPVASLPRRGKHAKKYREPRARTQTYYKSALPYLTTLLNHTILASLSNNYVDHGP